jgi:hypothetical protein
MLIAHGSVPLCLADDRSKAALNQMIRTLDHEVRSRRQLLGIDDRLT